MRKMHGSSSDDARGYRQRGHDNALKFALAIGLPRDYQNDKKAKREADDQAADALRRMANGPRRIP
jgi:hypothetical protein